MIIGKQKYLQMKLSFIQMFESIFPIESKVFNIVETKTNLVIFPESIDHEC